MVENEIREINLQDESGNPVIFNPKTTVEAVEGLEERLNLKQDNLISGKNIKTINGNSITGSGNIMIDTGGVGEKYINPDGSEGGEVFNDYVWNKAESKYSHAEGSSTTANGQASHTEGYSTTTVGDFSHVEGISTNNASNLKFGANSDKNLSIATDSEITNKWGTVKFSLAKGLASHIEGKNNLIIGDFSHAEGYQTLIIGQSSHAEGYQTYAVGPNSHAEGHQTCAVGPNSHAEGGHNYQNTPDSNNSTDIILLNDKLTRAIGNMSHAEGDGTESFGGASHTEGRLTLTTGNWSHAEGCICETHEIYSHAEGIGSRTIHGAIGAHTEGYYTIARNEYEHAEGMYNKPNNGLLYSLGIGTSEENRRNLIECYKNGNVNIYPSALNIGLAEQPISTSMIYSYSVVISNYDSSTVISGGDVTCLNLNILNNIFMGNATDITAKNATINAANANFELSLKTNSFKVNSISNNENNSTNDSIAFGNNINAGGYNSIGTGEYTISLGRYSRSSGYSISNKYYTKLNIIEFINSTDFEDIIIDEANNIIKIPKKYFPSQLTYVYMNDTIENYINWDQYWKNIVKAHKIDNTFYNIGFPDENEFAIILNYNEVFKSNWLSDYSSDDIYCNFTFALMEDWWYSLKENWQDVLLNGAMKMISIYDITDTKANGNFSHAVGLGIITDGIGSFATGYGTVTNNIGETAVGLYNMSNTDKPDGYDPNYNPLLPDYAKQTLYSIGCGSVGYLPSLLTRKNALEVMKNGRLFINGIGGYNGSNAVPKTPESILPKDLSTVINEKQDILIGFGVGLNIKTINNQSILGEGNITIESGSNSGVGRKYINQSGVEGGEVFNKISKSKIVTLKPGDVYTFTINTDHTNALIGEDGNVKGFEFCEASWGLYNLFKPLIDNHYPIEVKYNLTCIADATTITRNFNPRPSKMDISTGVYSNDGIETDIISFSESEYKSYETIEFNLRADSDISFETITDGNKASGNVSHAEGDLTTASGESSHAEGDHTTASGSHSHAEGSGTTASNEASHAEGGNTTASGSHSHAEGSGTTASNEASHAEGYWTTASGPCSHAEGNHTTASGMFSHAEGLSTTADNYIQHTQGQYNTKETTPSPYSYDATKIIFSIGNGTSDTDRSDALKMTGEGNMWLDGTLNQKTADYAEMFEWSDGNINNEDRVGYFVTLNKKKISKAVSKNKYILGIVSGTPSVIGDNPNLWHELYINDEWGRPIYEDVEVKYTDYETNEKGERIEVEKTRIDHIRKINPNWDASKPYVDRTKRKEWSAIGLMGKLLIRLDGTLVEGGYCKSNDQGIATKSTTGYYVMEVINKNQALILFK